MSDHSEYPIRPVMGVIVKPGSRSLNGSTELVHWHGDGRSRALGTWLASYGSPNTQDAYRRDAGYWFSWCDTNGIDPAAARRSNVDDYARYLDSETPPLSPATKARRIAAVSAFYRYWLYEGVVPANPAAHVRRPKVSPEPGSIALTKEEMCDLLDYIDRIDDLRSAVIVRVLAELGIRVSELCNSTVADLGYSSGHRTLAFTRKGNVGATLPLAPRTGDLVDRYLAGREAGWLVITSTGTRLERQYIRKLLRRLSREAGHPPEVWKKMHPHVLRHTAATLLNKKGRKVQDIQQLLGHADSRTTQRYIDYQEDLDSSPVYDLAGLYAA